MQLDSLIILATQTARPVNGQFQMKFASESSVSKIFKRTKNLHLIINSIFSRLLLQGVTADLITVKSFWEQLQVIKAQMNLLILLVAQAQAMIKVVKMNQNSRLQKVILKMIILQKNKENYLCATIVKNQFKIQKRCLFVRVLAISYSMNIVLLS